MGHLHTFGIRIWYSPCTQFKKDSPYIVSSSCNCHCLKLAIKDSAGARLLGDIKEYLMKLYYLYNKSCKKLRALENLIKNLKRLAELEGYYIEDTGSRGHLIEP